MLKSSIQIKKDNHRIYGDRLYGKRIYRVVDSGGEIIAEVSAMEGEIQMLSDNISHCWEFEGRIICVKVDKNSNINYTVSN